jgi:hypothetical protein
VGAAEAVVVANNSVFLQDQNIGNLTPTHPLDLSASLFLSLSHVRCTLCQRLPFLLSFPPGLVKQVVRSIPRHVIQRLTFTFLTLPLSHISDATRLNEREVKLLLMKMCEKGEISAKIDEVNGNHPKEREREDIWSG